VVQYSVKKKAATVGQNLLGLQYVNTSGKPTRWITHRQRAVYALLTIGAVWVESRFDDFAALSRHMSSATHVCNVHEIFRAAEIND